LINPLVYFVWLGFFVVVVGGGLVWVFLGVVSYWGQWRVFWERDSYFISCIWHNWAVSLRRACTRCL